MNVLERTFKALEWRKLADCLSSACETEAGRLRCREMMPATDLSLARQWLTQTQEAKTLVEQNAFPSLFGLPPVNLVLERLASGASLDAVEFLHLRCLLELTRTTRLCLIKLDPPSFPSLTHFTPALKYVASLHEQIVAKISDKGHIKDDASPRLIQLKAELSAAHARIKSTLTAIIHAKQEAKCLQEPLFTQRNGRYVLPVVAGLKGAVKGIVHDTSVSGSTIYIEPESVIDEGNRVRITEVEIEREIERILSELSATAHRHLAELSSSSSTLIDLDVIFAKARLGIAYTGIVPIINDKNAEPGFDLRGVRHALLLLPTSSNSVIANDIQLGKKSDNAAEAEKRTLVITGPNTGGKTVLLKSIGLCALMLKAGMMIPVQTGSSMSLFTEILADIGDEQSLEQSLSTFSSHLTNIIEIVNQSRRGCLILLDEIGAGTDPREGSALAQASLEHLNRSGALTVVTTHMNELKILAYTDESFINGNFEFNRDDFRPTYHFNLGSPGASHAIKIAERLGLEESIIRRTEDLLAGGSTTLNDTISRLEESLARAIVREEAAHKAQVMAELAEADLRHQLHEHASQQESLSQKLQAEFATAKEAIRHTIANLQKEPSLSRAQAAKDQIDLLKDSWSTNKHAGKTEQENSFQPGDLVRIISLNQDGHIEKMARPKEGNKSALYVVRARDLKFVVSANDIKISVSGGSKKPTRKSTSAGAEKGNFARRPKTTAPNTMFVRTDTNTLNLRGLRVDVALAKLGDFIDTAVLTDISPLMIIHGHGTGALKQMVREALSTSSFAITFRPGELHEGGDGVTLVSLTDG